MNTVTPVHEFFPTTALGIFVFGKFQTPDKPALGQTLDWRLSQLVDRDEEFQRRLKATLSHLDSNIVAYAPDASQFNKKIVQPDDFGIPFRQDGFQVLAGAKADGLVLPKYHTALFCTADCPVVVLWDKNCKRVVAFHCGRDSVLDWDCIENGFGAHLWNSVVRNAIGSFPENERSDVRAGIFCCIAPQHFSHPITHPEHGERNRKMISSITRHFGKDCFVGHDDQGNLCLTSLIIRQLQVFGKVSAGRIHNSHLDTFTNPQLWSHRRNEPQKGNNLIVVSRI